MFLYPFINFFNIYVLCISLFFLKLRYKFVNSKTIIVPNCISFKNCQTYLTVFSEIIFLKIVIYRRFIDLICDRISEK